MPPILFEDIDSECEQRGNPQNESDTALAGIKWRRCDLAQELYEEFGVSVEESTIGRVLREMGYAKLSARPRQCAGEGAIGPSPPAHAQNEYVVDDLKSFPAELAKIRTRLGPGVEIEPWWQDEARVGQSEREKKMIQ